MKIKKTIFWVSGGISALLVLLGIGMFIFPEFYTKIIGGILAALCLCFGILTALPIFVIGLILGIAVIFLPKVVSGILFVAVGVLGMIVGLILGLEMCRKSSMKPKNSLEGEKLSEDSAESVEL